MGINISVHASTAQEFFALESEGAPQLNITSGNTAKLLSYFGLEYDQEHHCGSIDPHHILDRAHEARDNAWRWDNDLMNPYMTYDLKRVDALIEIAEVARNLRRDISYG